LFVAMLFYMPCTIMHTQACGRASASAGPAAHLRLASGHATDLPRLVHSRAALQEVAHHFQLPISGCKVQGAVLRWLLWRMEEENGCALTPMLVMPAPGPPFPCTVHTHAGHSAHASWVATKYQCAGMNFRVQRRPAHPRRSLASRMHARPWIAHQGEANPSVLGACMCAYVQARACMHVRCAVCKHAYSDGSTLSVMHDLWVHRVRSHTR